MTAAARVLVVDDDPTVAEVVRTYLLRAGLQVELAADGVSALAAATRNRPELVVMDLMLPGLSGLEVCARLRRTRPDLPIIMLTALGTESDRVHGLEQGADDYLVKPFSPRELVLRVQALLRRSGAVPTDGSLPNRLVSGSVEIDVPGRVVTVDGVGLALTSREFDLLVHLLAHPGRAFSRQELMQQVWGWDFGDTSTVTVHVRRLREKVEPDPARPQRLVTVWGIGYRWQHPDEKAVSPADGPSSQAGATTRDGR